MGIALAPEPEMGGGSAGARARLRPLQTRRQQANGFAPPLPMTPTTAPTTAPAAPQGIGQRMRTIAQQGRAGTLTPQQSPIAQRRIGARDVLNQGRQAAGRPPLGTPPAPTTPPPQDAPQGMRAEVYTPGNDPRLTGAQTATDAAAGAVQTGPTFSTMAQGGEGRYRSLFGTGAVAGGPNVDAVESARTQRYGTAQDDALAGLGGPNRTELAKAALSDFDAQDAESRKNSYRALTQNAAGAGRLGMMDEARNVLDTERRFDQDRMRFANDLARSVAEGDISDRFRRVETTAGLRGQESDLDAQLRGERRIERGYDTDLDIGNQDRGFQRLTAATGLAGRDASADIADRYDRYNTAGSLEDRVFGQGQSNRGEFRQERGRMDDQAQQTIENRIRQRQLEMEEQDAAFRRALAQSQVGGR